MIPLIAPALFSVLGQFAVKLVSSFLNRSKEPSADTATTGAPRDEFAALLQQSRPASEPSPAGAGAAPADPAASSALFPPAPVLLASAGSTIPLPGVARPAATDMATAASTYQRIQEFQAP